MHHQANLQGEQELKQKAPEKDDVGKKNRFMKKNISIDKDLLCV